MVLTTRRLVRHKHRGRLAALTSEDGRFCFTVPSDVPAFLLSANEAVLQGRQEDARQHLETMQISQVEDLLAKDGSRTDILFILAKLLVDTEQYDQAEIWFRRILAIEPHAHVYDQLSRLLFRHNVNWGKAAEYSRLAHEAMPQDISFHQNWARSLVRIGRLEEGIAEFRRAKELHPLHSGVWLNYLWFSQYAPEMSGQAINAGYQQWARLAVPQQVPIRLHQNSPDPHRRLRVGYLSPNFRHHAVNYMFEQILDGHDRQQVTVLGYGHVSHPDATTERLKRKFDGYRDLWGQDAVTVADWIQADEVDILVEIGGHVIDNRLDVIRLKPAPLQMDMGGLSTTGLPQVDYRLTDVVYDPPGRSDHYGETCLYLSGGLSCFRVPESELSVQSLPVLTQGHFTFGSFNSHAKISAQIFELWIRILRALPGSRMVVKFAGAENPGIRATYWERFEQQGVARERVDLIGWQDWDDHWQLFNQVDLLLDTYPYNGGTTTLEGLWMGVPTVSLSGDKFVARAGRSILQRVDLEIFAAHAPEEYVNKALAFAQQPSALAEIRQGLRARMINSSLCDSARMARELEILYRQSWHAWCVERGGDA